MNGSVSPVVGIIPIVTAIWRKAVIPIPEVIPTARYWPNGSAAVRAIRNPSQTNAEKRRMIAVTPMNPHSSPIEEKRKSE